ncbi:MAG: type II toxin-antitoxin system PemK/MazF family toxin [Anaerolineales bacterium]
MGKFVKGAIVILPFPFSDLTTSKKRPAFVIADLDGNDVIVCQITSKVKSDHYSISLSKADFKSGRLDQDSFIRPNRLFTADANIVLYKAGNANSAKIDEVIAKVIEIIKQ